MRFGAYVGFANMGASVLGRGDRVMAFVPAWFPDSVAQ